MNYLFDSWSWIELIQATSHGEKIKKILDNEDNDILISSINIAEVYKFMLINKGLKAAEDVLDFMRANTMIIFVSTQIAVESAKLNHKLKIGLGDSLVYATALLNNAVLVTGDNDFKGKEKVMYLS